MYNDSIKRVALLVVLFSGIATVLGCGWFLFGDSIQEWLQREEFDPVAWKAGNLARDAVRIRMIDDLLSRHDFHGMSKSQVIAIIGEPDQTDYFNDWDLVYCLGPERGFLSIDSEWLVLRFDNAGKIIDYRIVRD